MPAERRSLEITDAYRARLVQLRDQATQLAAARWELAPEDLDASHSRWLELAATALRATQQAGVRLTAAYAAAFLASELRQPSAPPAIDATRYAGMSRDGRLLEDALAPSLYTVKAAIADGQSFEEASALGRSRALRAVASDAIAAPRAALADVVREDGRIVGWRRVTSGGCGACLAAATGAIHADDEALAVHDNCRCSMEPVVKGVPDRATRPTGRELFDGMSSEDQDRLLGAEKAELVRSGEAPLEALIDSSPMATVPDQLTEAPLEALRPRP